MCRGYRLWRLHPLSGWGIPDWIRSSISAIYSCAVFLMEWGLSVSGMCRGYCLWRLHPLPGWGIPDWIRFSVFDIYSGARTLSLYICLMG